MAHQYLIVIVGPTAIGKTALSIQLARIWQTEIISADARQFYRDMPIGTAQPTAVERADIPHHFVAFLSILENHTAGKFEQAARKCLEKLFLDKTVVIATGGSGLYIKALCEGLAEMPSVVPHIRMALREMLQTQGLDYLTKWLSRVDPAYYCRVDLHNPQRVIRALEVYLTTAIPYTSWRTQPPKEKPSFYLIKVGLNQEKKILHQWIDQRVESMMAAGLLQEVEKLYSHKSTNALQTIGYQELFDYMDGQCSLVQAIEQIKIHTKQYAKRQMTWFKKDPAIKWFTPDDLSSIQSYIEETMQAVTS